MEDNIKVIDLAVKIDHTLLRPEVQFDDVKVLCREAMEHHFATVCIPPLFVQDAAKILRGSGVKVATVIGFPFGYSATSAKVEEAKNAFDNGAKEIDVVMNVTAFKNKRWSYVKNDIQSVTTTAHLQNKIIKVIIESGILTEEEILRACEICTESEVDFVKTSTGFNGPGASVDVVRLLRANLPENIRIKASGGIRTRDFAESLIEAGADRIGSSTSVNLIS